MFKVYRLQYRDRFGEWENGSTMGEWSYVRGVANTMSFYCAGTRGGVITRIIPVQ
jgi:hypothetical protein